MICKQKEFHNEQQGGSYLSGVGNVPLVRWAARFAQMRKTSLTVLLCLFDELSFPWEPVTAEHPTGSEKLMQVAAEAFSETHDMEVHPFVMRHPDPGQTI